MHVYPEELQVPVSEYVPYRTVPQLYQLKGVRTHTLFTLSAAFARAPFTLQLCPAGLLGRTERDASSWALGCKEGSCSSWTGNCDASVPSRWTGTVQYLSRYHHCNQFQLVDPSTVSGSGHA